MNEFNLSLEPTLKPIYSKSAYSAAQAHKNNNRELFYALIHISDHYDILPAAYQYLKQHFQLVTEQYTANYNKKYSTPSISNLLKHTESPHTYPLSETALTICLLHYTPVYFTELGWLATISQTVTCQTPLVVDLMAIYSRLVNKGKYSIANSRAIYHAYLLAAGIEIPALHSIAFAKQAEVIDEVFDFATIQVALAQFPRVFFPEILGFTLSYCQSQSLLELFVSEDSTVKLPSFISTRTTLHQQEIPQITQVIRTYLAEFEDQTDALWQRIQTGFWLHQQQLELCAQRINARLHNELSPRQAVEKLLSSLIPNAIGHHGKIRLGGKTIDDWFKEKPFKSANFLATLLHTPYVDRIKPENSKLLTLFEFNGPMFGVLDKNGQTILKDWLLTELSPGLMQARKHKTTSHKLGLKSIVSEFTPQAISLNFQEETNQSAAVNYSKLSNRDLYYYLINCDLYPEVLPVAKQKVSWILTKVKFFSRLPFRRYTHEAFEDYINSVYQHEVASYKPLGKKPKLAKSAFVWGIEQFAPTILTDGSWLQSVRQLDYTPNHAVGAFLSRIYDDEIGNGKLEQNHPFIYQDLLNSIGCKLPPIYSKAFVNHSGFISTAFDIPVFLMAIAKFPNAFLPELLGLNMAIEISGLGKVYLQLSEELKFWGLNPAIVDVHTSIDNLASGHSALAIKAIQTYLDEIKASFGEEVMQTHWRRIYTGYCSLKSVSNRFKVALISQYHLKHSSST